MKVNFTRFKNLKPDKKLELFMNSLARTNRKPDYYVNWDKVVRNTKPYEIELNTLNYLIGKENIYEDTLSLFSQQPNLIKAIPSLIACRDKKFDVLFVDENANVDFYDLDFNNINKNNVKQYVDFCAESGLLDFLKLHANRSLVDYVYGVESGLDSNARKNRSGAMMESIVEKSVKEACKQLGYTYITQATAQKIKRQWGLRVPVDKSKRRFDFAIYDERRKKAWVIETNYYGSGGSKLKSVAGEFTTLNALIDTTEDDINFIWITDGKGWNTARIPLSEAFMKIDNIFNIDMLNNNYLIDKIKI